MVVDVSVIIVNYNVKDRVDACIDSVYKSNTTNLNIEIFFVDNNSIDGSYEHIKNKYPDVICIKNDRNLGFSKANNIALKQAKGKYILILNPDTILEENTFVKLIEFIKTHDRVGAVSSKLILGNGQLDTACKRSFPTLSVALPRMLGLSKIFPRSKIFGKYNLLYLDENQTHEVDSICGAFMFISKSILEEVGYFDEDYFMYGEDIDLCYRIKKAGYKNYYFPEVTTIHLKGSSTRKTNLSYVNTFFGAMAIFVKKHLSSKSNFLYYLIRFGIFLRSLLSYLKRVIRLIRYPALDAILLFISFIIAIQYRFHIFPNEKYLFIISVYITIWLINLFLFGSYFPKNKHYLLKPFNALVSGFFINASITYFFKDYAFSREVVVTASTLSIVFLVGYRAMAAAYRFFSDKNIMLSRTNILVIGNKKLDQNIGEKLQAKYNVSYYNDVSTKRDLSDIEDIVNLNSISEIVFTGEDYANKDILNLMWRVRKKNISFKFVASGIDLILSRLNSNIDSVGLVELEYNINNKLNVFKKRLFDIAISFILLLTIYPFIFLYWKVREGKPGKYNSKLLLLPQVLTGKLSLVGMPIWFEAKGNEYLGKKGLTGVIQVNYRPGMTEDEMIDFCVFYAKNQSLLLDIELLLKTIFTIIKKTT
ncbi:MAG: glycosyltransferase [Ignavibacteria bacterium]